MSRTAAARLVLAVVALRLAFAVFPSAAALQPSESSVIAANINSGRGFTFEQYGTIHHAWKEPLHIVLLAGLMRAPGGWAEAVIRLFQAACTAAAALLVAWLAVRLTGNPQAALPAGMLAAFNPFLLYYDTRWVHPLSFDALLAVALLVCGLKAIAAGPSGLRWTAACAAVLGAALWQRSAFLMPVLGFWVAVVAASAGRRRLLLLRAGICVAIGVLVVSPWLLRNLRYYGRLLMTTDASHIIWLGNNPRSNGTYSDATGRRIFHTADAAFQKRIYGASELAQYGAFLEEAGHFVRTQPAAYLRLALRRLSAFFWFSPNAGVTYAAAERLLYMTAYTLLLAAGAWGATVSFIRAGAQQRVLLMATAGFIAGLAAFHALTVINLKHRVPLELVLCAFAGGRLAALKQRLKAAAC